MIKKTKKSSLTTKVRSFDRELVPFRIAYELTEKNCNKLSAEEVVAVACAIMLNTSHSDELTSSNNIWRLNSLIEGVSRCE